MENLEKQQLLLLNRLEARNLIYRPLGIAGPRHGPSNSTLHYHLSLVHHLLLLAGPSDRTDRSIPAVPWKGFGSGSEATISHSTLVSAPPDTRPPTGQYSCMPARSAFPPPFRPPARLQNLLDQSTILLDVPPPPPPPPSPHSTLTSVCGSTP